MFGWITQLFIAPKMGGLPFKKHRNETTIAVAKNK